MNAPLSFALLDPARRSSGILSPRAAATLLGALAVPLWATWPALSVQMRAIPALECAGLAFLVAFCLLLRIEPRGHSPAAASFRSWIPALAFALGQSGSAVFFLLATRWISAGEANLIVYLWPGMIVGMGALLGLFRLRIPHVLGVMLGFAGAAVVVGASAMTLSYAGIGLAFLGAISWALYCVFRLRWRGPAPALLARGCGISALLCAIVHFLLEPSVVPDAQGWLAVIGTGILPTALAALSWDTGIRNGDSRLLAVMAYATPLCSTLLLIALGLQLFSLSLLIGAVLIALGGVLSRT